MKKIKKLSLLLAFVMVFGFTPKLKVNIPNIPNISDNVKVTVVVPSEYLKNIRLNVKLPSVN
jgi:hypothetical protein